MISTKERQKLISKYGQWAVITGASSGIGKAFAHQLAEIGFDVILSGRNQKALVEVKRELEEKHDVQCEVVPADLGGKEFDHLFSSTKDKEVGLLIASAGYGTSGELIYNSIHEELNMVQVNCSALLAMVHHFSQLFVRQKRGGIILLSSIVAFQGVPYAANYSATKAYVQSLAEGLYHELKPYGVDVLSASPGPVKSGFEKRANMKMNQAMTPENVVIPALKSLGRKSVVFPGWFTKLLTYSLMTVPRAFKVRIMKLVMGGMTAHQREQQSVGII